MGRVLTNNTGLQYAVQEAFETLGASPDWKITEPNGSITFGADITTTPRSPISKNRQRRKGSTTDLDSEVSYEADATIDSLLDFMEGFCFAQAVNHDLTFRAANATATTDVFTVPALTAAQAAKIEVGTLFWASGYSNAGNNGLHVVSTAGSAAATTIVAIASTLVTETAPANAEISLAGFRAAASDLALTVTAGVGTLTSATSVPDWSVLGVTVGQTIHVGGVVAGNQFSAGAGFARVKAIATNVLTLDKLDATLATDPGTGETVDILWGRFVRNVTVDDTEFLERYFEFEASFPNLFETTPPTPLTYPNGYEYALNNLCDSISISIQGQSLATLTAGFIGTDSEPPVDDNSRKTNAATARQPLFTAALNTAADFVRLRIQDVDETGLTTDFKNLTVTFNNGVTPDKILGQLAAKYLNTGNFEVSIEAEVIFSSPLVPARVRNNTTVVMDWIMQNIDGAVAFDIPSMDLAGAGKDYPINESVKLSLTGNAFQDAIFGTSIGVSFFPVTPTSYAAA